MKEIKFGKIFDNKRFLMVFSLIVSILIWIISAFTIRDDATVTLYDVPVIIDYSSSLLQRLNLDAIDIQTRTADVRVYGKRHIVGNVTANDVTVTALISSITDQGTYSLELVAENISSNEFDILSVNPNRMEITFDRIVERRFYVEAEIVGAIVPEGYIMQDAIVSPDALVVTGPESIVNRIEYCVATVHINRELDRARSVTSNIMLLDSDSNAVESDYITMSANTVDITIPIIKKKTLPLRIGFLNIPRGFNINNLVYTLSANSIEVAGPPSVIDNLNELFLDYVDLKNLNGDSFYSFEVLLPSNIVNLDNLETVTVDFDVENMATELFTIRDIRIVNAPANYDITISTAQITNVRITGSIESLRALGEGDLIAEVDISVREITTGQSMVPVAISAPSKGGVWANGDYYIMITVKERQ